MEHVFVLLPVHDRREVTRRFVACLRRQDHPRITLVVLDDGSTDGTGEMVRELVPSAVVLRGDGSWWWAGALQRGWEWIRDAEASADDVVCIMNDDTEFDPDFVSRGVALVRANPRTFVTAVALDRETGRVLDPGQHVDWRALRFTASTRPEDLNCTSTRGLFLTVRDFRETGGFHPRLLPHYGSDYEFTTRAHRRGMRLLTTPELSLRLDDTTTGIHDPVGESFLDTARRCFSRRSTSNPLMWTAFIVLACPWPWKPRHVARTWIRTAVQLTAAAVRRKSSRSRPAPPPARGAGPSRSRARSARRGR